MVGGVVLLAKRVVEVVAVGEEGLIWAMVVEVGEQEAVVVMDM